MTKKSAVMKQCNDVNGSKAGYQCIKCEYRNLDADMVKEHYRGQHGKD